MAAARQVFAHYMVGLTDGQSADQWQQDITDAQNSGIDGFALNVGSSDSWNDAQLPLAYNAAASSGFSLFFSFDMAASTWTVDQVVSYVNTYKGYGSQLKINDLPLVSTFEGPDWADNWASVRSSTGGIFLMPDWASLGAQGVADKLSLIDGAFNWGAWPQPNQDNMTTGDDVAYTSDLQGKPYMMGVSPYFYTDLPQYSKNWYSSSDSLWYDRWKQVLGIMPEYIEIITWNDYGESSYINAPVASQIVSGAEGYVDGFDHTAFRFVLPYFIAAYKNGNPDVAVPTEGAMAWYRTTPVAVCGDGGTVWGQDGSASAAGGTSDVISVIALAEAPTSIDVSIDGSSQPVNTVGTVGKATFYQIPFDGKTGAVTITMNGESTTGPEITNICPSSGHVNFNAVSIQV
ncbi:Uu.00g120270.m01.CDS01 [Anthostomella pinea]|uniref:Uu.00g120270.m01.CDS01 n=1 Tax=Anthostomella pinea TaxID=933095 RepID=A0AAI8YES9_9PEZI|nr:Uu.00g120270.m01.CDS01 [Anthostomella pinea]